MTINKETILVSLAAGVVIGVLAVLCRFFDRISAGKWLRIFLQDATLTVLAVMITFLVSFPVSRGRIRLLQVALEALSFSAVWLIFSPTASRISERYMYMKLKVHKSLAMARQKLSGIMKKPHEIAKKPKKTLAISSQDNI